MTNTLGNVSVIGQSVGEVFMMRRSSRCFNSLCTNAFASLLPASECCASRNSSACAPDYNNYCMQFTPN